MKLFETTTLVPLALMVTACALLPEPPDLTCEAWLQMERQERIQVAATLAGDTADRLERIRTAQHLEPGTPRTVIVEAVVGSLDKNCQFEPQRTRLRELMDAMYGP